MDRFTPKSKRAVAKGNKLSASSSHGACISGCLSYFKEVQVIASLQNLGVGTFVRFFVCGFVAATLSFLMLAIHEFSVSERLIGSIVGKYKRESLWRLHVSYTLAHISLILLILPLLFLSIYV